MKNYKILILVFAITLPLSSCSNPYKDGVEYDEFPDREVPIYDDAVVYSYDEDDDEWEIEYGTEDDIDDIVDFYLDEFAGADYMLDSWDEEKDEFSCEGYVLEDDLHFEITAEEAKGDEEKYFDYVVTIEVEEKAAPDFIVYEEEPAETEAEPSELIEEPAEETSGTLDLPDISPSITPLEIDTTYDLGYLQITALAGWYIYEFEEGIQIYDETGDYIQVSIQGENLDDDYAKLFTESIASSYSDASCGSNTFLGYEFYHAFYPLDSRYFTTYAAIYGDDMRMILINMGYTVDHNGMSPEIETMFSNIEIKVE